MVALTRQFTAERINPIINHPSIRPYSGGDGDSYIDWSAKAANHDNVCLVGEHGCVLFVKHQPGIYEFHTSVLPEGRGEWMVEGSKTAFSYLFTHADAFELMTMCPYGNIAAKAGAKIVGCSPRFTTRPLYPRAGELVNIDVYSIILQEWVKNAEGLVDVGKWFHNQLELEYTRLGKDLTVHEDDETHDRYVGATIEMMRNGQVYKAVSFYNRWAVMAGYRKISVISTAPWVIDIYDCRLKMSNDEFQVVE
jgi:hypothetical protein